MENFENSKAQWDRLWTKKITSFYLGLPFSVAIENFIRRELYFKPIAKLLGSLSLTNKDILELGSGTGSNSLYLAQFHKARSVTLVDFSEKALARVRDKFFPCPLIKIQEDLFNFSPKRKYDFVHSSGLVEHFSGRERLLVVKKHSQLAQNEGWVMIWVPIFSKTFQIIRKFNQWLGIKEIPFTPEELKFYCQKSKLKIINEKKILFGSLYGILARKIR